MKKKMAMVVMLLTALSVMSVSAMAQDVAPAAACTGQACPQTFVSQSGTDFTPRVTQGPPMTRTITQVVPTQIISQRVPVSCARPAAVGCGAGVSRLGFRGLGLYGGLRPYLHGFGRLGLNPLRFAHARLGRLGWL